MSPTPLRVVPLVSTIGTVDGHRIDLLSAEVWDSWWDLRFARVDDGATVALARRVPPAAAWVVTDDRGTVYEVIDSVGRGNRAFSNGEVRLRPTLARDATALHVTVDLGPGVVRGEVSLRD